MRLFQLSLAAFAVAAILSGLAFALDFSPCTDGTAYGKCSTVNPGNYCTGTPSALQMYPQLCRCDAVPGWVQQGEGDTAACIQAKCTDNTQAGACSSTKPKVCIAGALVDNATKCGCPTGKKISSNGITCEFIPCTDSGINVPEGTCSPKTSGKKCVGGVLVDKASECPCKASLQKIGEQCVAVCSDDTKTGECSTTKPKECILSGTGVAVLLDNAVKCGCPSGKTAVGKQCTDSMLGGFGGNTEVLGGAPSGNGQEAAQQPAGASALTCCCLPTALIGLIGGFAFFRKKE